jgi:hypothetical protein
LIYSKKNISLSGTNDKSYEKEQEEVNQNQKKADFSCHADFNDSYPLGPFIKIIRY